MRVRAPVVVFALSLAVRLAWVLWHPPVDSEVLTRLNDSTDYDHLARMLLSTGGIGSVLRPPVYPAFVALAYAVCGVGNLLAVAVAQCFVGATESVLAWAIARRAGLGERAASVAGIADALYPMFVFQSGLVLAEVLHRCIMMAFVLVALGRGGFPAGALLGLAILSKPVLLAAAPFVAAWRWRTSPPDAKAALLLATGVAAAVLPWTARNYVASGCIVPVCANFPVTAAHGASAKCLYAAQWYGADRLMPVPDDLLWNTQVRAYGGPREEVAVADEYARRVRAFALADPVFFVRLSFRKALHFWSPLIQNPSRAARGVGFASMAAVLVLGWMGVLRAIRAGGDGARFAWLCLAIALPATIPHALSMPDVRYRSAIVDPLWVVLAAGAAAGVWERFRSGRARFAAHRRNGDPA